jgi:hypothetical protein
VLPCCGNTLLQITAMMQVRFIQFIHLDHTSKEPADCLHTKPPDEYIQAVLKEGDRGVITIGVGELLAGSDERTISFLVRNLNLAEIDNHHNIPLKVEIG